MNTFEIIGLEKNVLGKNTKYNLSKLEKDKYLIEIIRDNDKVGEEFYGDFFDIVALFKMICDTDTLPENLCDISADSKFATYV